MFITWNPGLFLPHNLDLSFASQNIIKVGSALLDPKNKEQWEQIQRTEGGTAHLLRHYEDYFNNVAQNMKKTYMRPFVIVAANMSESPYWKLLLCISALKVCKIEVLTTDFNNTNLETQGMCCLTYSVHSFQVSSTLIPITMEASWETSDLLSLWAMAFGCSHSGVQMIRWTKFVSNDDVF